MNSILAVAAGFLLLAIGGEMLVRGSVQAAKKLGVSELLIGLTLVGFATSMPEMVTSVQASMDGSPGIAIGNFVGSNISNILLILGLAAVIFPIKVDSKCLERDGYFVVATAVAFAATSLLLPYDRLLGLGFVATLMVYIAYAIHHEMRGVWRGHTSAYEKSEAYKRLREKPPADASAPTADEAIPPAASAIWPAVGLYAALAIAGLLIVTLGARLMVVGASGLARASGIPEEIIGLTIVAIGTSLPEFVTSLVAALRGFPAVALGNIMGSNIYNTLGIGGLTALIAPTTIPPQIVFYDNLVMVAASLAFILFATVDLRIRRWEGLALVFAYIAYLISLFPVSHHAWAIEAIMGAS
ncbi:MAG: inner membrane protein YrbG [Pseudomonadota bacterium]|jgi:cation:H+ antiporter